LPPNKLLVTASQRIFFAIVSPHTDPDFPLRIILRVLSDILEAVDEGKVTILASFAVSAAFDKVDHAISL